MIVLDSDLIINVLLAREPGHLLFLRLRKEGEPLATTSINAAEVLRGAHATGSEPAVAAANLLLDGLDELPFGPRAARRFARLTADLDRRGQPMGVPDALIAAVVLENGARLATANRRDFKRVPHLELVSP